LLFQLAAVMVATQASLAAAAAAVVAAVEEAEEVVALEEAREHTTLAPVSTTQLSAAPLMSSALLTSTADLVSVKHDGSNGQ
jgi:hypothetical protein